jgi:3-oxoadipate enol-lactonase
MTGLGESVAAANVSSQTRATRPGVLALVSRVFEEQPQDGYVLTARALMTWRARPLPPLDGIACLAITGEEDRYAPPEDVRALAASLPGAAAVAVLPGCGHLPFLEDPQAFSQVVDQFLPRL